MATLSELAIKAGEAKDAEIMEACGGIKVSLYANAFDKIGAVESLGEVLCAVRRCDLGEEIARLRHRLANGDRRAYDAAKRSLPGVTLSAVLASRETAIPVAERVVAHTGILQADFDGKQNQHFTPAQMAEAIQADPHVLAWFTSPSGEGLKALVRIPASVEGHARAFEAAAAHFRRYTLEMDPAAKDVGRLCFLGADAGIGVNAGAVEMDVGEAEEGTERTEGTKTETARQMDLPARDGFPETTVDDVREMLGFIPPKPAYHDWLRIASAVFSVLPMADGIRVLAEWSPEEREGEYARKWKARLKTVNVGTLAWYAERHGFDARAAARRRVWAGRIKFAHGSRAPGRRDPETVAEAPPEAVELDQAFVADCVDRGQRGDADLWARLALGTHCWDTLAQVWRRYSLGCWEKDDAGVTRIEMIDAVTGVYDEMIEGIREKMRENPLDREKDPRRGRIEAIQKRKAKLCATGYANGVLEMARALLPAAANEFDREPHLLACENVVVDFSEGRTREFRPEDRLTKRLPVRFDAEAECPLWEGFLMKCMGGDEAMVNYLKRCVGYSLSGFVDKDCLFFHHGKGANGKSTFMAALKMLAGDYMTTIDIESLLARFSDNNMDYKKAMLEGCRLAVTDEVPENRRLNEAAIKALVGGDVIVARRPYEKPYNFEPTHKLWMVGNHKPQITGSDLGIWRRIHLVPWGVTIPEDERRPRHEILAGFRRELPGILAWALAGYQEMLDMGGLCPPRQVVDAVKEYRSDSDQFALFFGDRCERVMNESTGLREMLHAYLAWCEDEGEDPLARSGRKLSMLLKDAGFRVEEGHARSRVVLGVRLAGVSEKEPKKQSWWNSKD